MNNTELSAEERGRTYRFLSSLCLKPPSDYILSMIREGRILSLVEEGSRAYDELSRFVEDVRRIENLEDELAAEHTALFVLPGGVLPHESVYLDKEKRLGGRVTISVKQFYEKAGADILNKCIEVPDHLGIELEFMAFLCDIEKELRKKDDIEGLRQCIEFQKTFLSEHLAQWAYACCEKIIKQSTYGLYKALAYLIVEFIGEEEGYISDLYAGVAEESYFSKTE
ncbi:MAG: molecular chaperone TorD family protein [Nitrospirae bacterium]|nr:molecular chaperone TorD family protein [Nitrospirota bacterium]